MTESPIFLTGLSRTGKTALQRALGAHPNLSMTRKTRLWTGFHGRYGDLAEPAALERCVDAMLRDEGVARLAPDAGAIRDELEHRDATYAELFGVLQDQHARRHGKSRWGEQTQGLEPFADEIIHTWPTARMIHLVRSPADWIPGRTQWLPGRLSPRIAAWARSAQLGLANREAHPDGYRIIRVESMIDDPPSALARIGEFVGVEITPCMLELFEDSLPTSVETVPLGVAARRYVDSHCAQLASDLGYADRPTWTDRSTTAARVARLWFGSVSPASGPAPVADHGQPARTRQDQAKMRP